MYSTYSCRRLLSLRIIYFRSIYVVASVSSLSLFIIEFYSFYGYTTICSFSCGWTFGFIPHSGGFFLWIQHPWTFAYKYFCGHMFLFLFSKYLGVEWLSSTVRCLSSFIKNCQVVLPSGCIILQSHQATYGSSGFSTSFTRSCQPF